MSTTPDPISPLSSRSAAEGPAFVPAHASGSHTGPRPFQPWVIFRKDILHIWPEVPVSLCLLVAYAWVRTLAAESATMLGAFNPWALLAGIIAFLIPLSWMVLISRLVHDEELVGARQFWIPRPYTW